jgi:septal ring factor EnvC (AmiA/AmiB activator)
MMIADLLVLLALAFIQSPQTPWEAWAKSVEERLAKAESAIKEHNTVHRALADALEKLRDTPEVVESKASEIQDKQSELQAAVDSVLAKQGEFNWQDLISTFVSCLASILVAVAVAVIRKLKLELESKIGQIVIEPTKPEAPK